jgi:uncharacterized protein (TIGR03435 family)
MFTTIRIFMAAGLVLAAERPTFDAASVKPNTDTRSRVSMTTNPGGIMFNAVSLADCLQAAYRVKRYQISGPDWLRTERYNITARTGAPASDDQVRSMLQSLLADRFHLSLHREQKELPMFGLQLGRSGPRLERGDPNGERNMTGGPGALVFTNTSMQDLADFLSGLPPIGRPVLDRTGLTGRFDFKLTLSAAQGNTAIEETKRAVVEGEPSIFTDALGELGLKLDAGKALIDVLVIDGASRVPTDD